MTVKEEECEEKEEAVSYSLKDMSSWNASQKHLFEHIALKKSNKLANKELLVYYINLKFREKNGMKQYD